MSLFQDSSCGPASALSKLNSHAAADRSVQQSVGRSQQTNGLNEFRSTLQVDEFLQNDFRQFSQQGSAGHGLQLQPQALQPQALQMRANQRIQMQNAGFSVDEFQEFQAFQRSQPQLQQQQQPQQAYTQQPMQFQQHAPQFQQTPQFQQHAQHAQHTQAEALSEASQQQWVEEFDRLQIQETWNEPIQKMPAYDSKREYVMQQEHLSRLQSRQQSRHHSPEPQEAAPVATASAYAQEFDALENEVREQENEEQKRKLAEIAKNVFASMTAGNGRQETAVKFQNSNFLRLMERVSQRQVEINAEGNKFIDSQGRDIRDMLPDPLRDLKEATEPFASAAEVQPGLQSGSWEEVFDDM